MCNIGDLVIVSKPFSESAWNDNRRNEPFLENLKNLYETKTIVRVLGKWIPPEAPHITLLDIDNGSGYRVPIDIVEIVFTL